MPNKVRFPKDVRRPQNDPSGLVTRVAGRSGVGLVPPLPVHSRKGLTPESALTELLAGNQRFASNQLTSIAYDLAILKERTVASQEPFAAVLGCADSRVPVELVFDQTIGQIFVTRVAGNIVTPEITASLEYAVAILGVKALLVLGHTSCGAVTAAMRADAVPGQISALYQHLRPAVEQSDGDVDHAVEVNAEIQAELLRTSSTVIGAALKAGKLKVEAGVYDLASGKVSLRQKSCWNLGVRAPGDPLV